MIKVTEGLKWLKVNCTDCTESQFLELEVNSSIETIDYTSWKDKK